MIVGRRTCLRPNYVATCPSLDVLPTCLRAYPAWCRSVRCSCFRFAFLLSIISVCMSPLFQTQKCLHIISSHPHPFPSKHLPDPSVVTSPPLIYNVYIPHHHLYDLGLLSFTSLHHRPPVIDSSHAISFHLISSHLPPTLAFF